MVIKHDDFLIFEQAQGKLMVYDVHYNTIRGETVPLKRNDRACEFGQEPENKQTAWSVFGDNILMQVEDKI